MKLLSLLLTFIIFNSYASSNIVGGEPVSPSDPISRFTVAVGAIGNSGKCSGFLIHPEFVITAGHCIWDAPSGFEVYFGVDVYPPEAYIKVSALRVLGGGNDGVNDLALLQLERPAPSNFKPIPMLDPRMIDLTSPLMLAGFGQSHPLRMYKVSLTPHDYDQGFIHFKQTLQSGGACYGDSGSPAIYQRGGQSFVVGYTTRGDAQDCTGTVTYVQISPHVDWIGQTMRELSLLSSASESLTSPLR